MEKSKQIIRNSKMSLSSLTVMMAITEGKETENYTKIIWTNNGSPFPNVEESPN
jgi:hypothetical protein